MANDLLIHSLTSSQKLLHRYLEDFTPADYLHRPCAKANCAAWLVGHLILTDRRGLAGLGVTDLPALPEGFEQRFSREEGVPHAAEFGDVTILRPLFDKHRNLMIEKLREISPAELDKKLDKPHPMFATGGERLSFLALHVAMHAGQITIIRRSLGRPPMM